MEPEEIFERQRMEYLRMEESPHNIIFLDVDGVLNTDVSKARSPKGYIGIDPGRAAILHEIVERNDAIVVLTSTWKKTWSRHVPELIMDQDAIYMVSVFAEEGVFAADKTYDDGYNRGEGIVKWLQSHPHKGWVVFDDEVFRDFREYGIYAHLIRTSAAAGGGLKEKHAKKADQLFRMQEEGKVDTEPKIADSLGETDKEWKHRHFGKQ